MCKYRAQTLAFDVDTAPSEPPHLIYRSSYVSLCNLSMQFVFMIISYS